MAGKAAKDKLVQGLGCVFITDKPGVLISSRDGNQVYLTIPEARRLLNDLPAAMEDSVSYVKKEQARMRRELVTKLLSGTIA